MKKAVIDARKKTVLALAFLGAVAVVTPAQSQPELGGPFDARFRGCVAAGWCTFWIESLDPFADSLYRVYPQGVSLSTDDKHRLIALRDRLNALLSSMVHQHKRIVLYDLREVGDGRYAAVITVNEADIALDPVVRAIQRGDTMARPQSH